jgi:putative DNA primase/helicase
MSTSPDSPPRKKTSWWASSAKLRENVVALRPTDTHHLVSRGVPVENLTIATGDEELLALRLRLYRNGYRPVPVSSPSPMGLKFGKAPLFKDWTTICARADETVIARYVKSKKDHGSTGILCGNVVGVDLDVSDESMAKEMDALAESMLGPTPLHRVGRAPKSLRVYRAEAPTPNLETPELYLADGSKHQVEVLGCEKQFVAFGPHRDTGKPYTWTDKLPLDLAAAELPAVSKTALLGFLEAAETLIRKAGGVTERERKKTAIAVAPQPKAKRNLPRDPSGANFFKSVNQAALGDIGRWFPSIHPSAKREAGTGAWRVKSKDLGRNLEEDISIHPALGGQDFGTRESCSPIDIVLKWGGAPSEKDAAFWLCEKLGVTPADLGWQESRRAANDTRPSIRIIAGDIERIVDEAERALIKANLGLYQRDNKIVIVATSPMIGADGKHIAGLRIFERGEHALTEDMARAAHFEKFDARSSELVYKDPPISIVKTLRQHVGKLRFPILAGVVTAPTLRPDGSILDQTGYDKRTGLLFDPQGVEFPPIPDRPTLDDAERALSVLNNLIGTFPFVEDRHRSVALSAILTAVARRSLRFAPMHAFSAPVAGSGKSKLVDVASVIATGREAGVIALAKEEEFEKRLASVLLAGDQIVSIDNCEQPLGGDLLCQMLTQAVVKPRILGVSQTPEITTGCFVLATGNNLRLLGDVTRRTILCRLDPKSERPEQRVFDRDPVEDAKAGRGGYVVAALTILRAYQVAGRPGKLTPLGGFTDWSDSVRSALVAFGFADPVDTIEEVRRTDNRLDELQAVLSQWHAAVGRDRVTAAEVIRVATETQPGYAHSEFVRPDFREALLAVAGQAGTVSGRRLGNWLMANKDRLIDGRKLENCGTRQNFAVWRLNADDGR